VRTLREGQMEGDRDGSSKKALPYTACLHAVTYMPKENTNLRGWLNTVDLLNKVDCFVKKVYNVCKV
jgi:hypothetical protein